MKDIAIAKPFNDQMRSHPTFCHFVEHRNYFAPPNRELNALIAETLGRISMRKIIPTSVTHPRAGEYGCERQAR